MKRLAGILFSVVFLQHAAYAMTRVDERGAGNDAANMLVNQAGKVEKIFAGAGKIVIGGVTYAYNPLSTAVTINGKRVTISDVRTGDAAHLQAVPQGAYQPALLTTLSVVRQ
jgi:hypothetical protein